MDDDLKSQILDELNSLFESYPPKREGDATVKDIMISRRICRSSARDIMRRAIDENPDKFEIVKVQSDEKGGAAWQWALRRKPVFS